MLSICASPLAPAAPTRSNHRKRSRPSSACEAMFNHEWWSDPPSLNLCMQQRYSAQAEISPATAVRDLCADQLSESCFLLSSAQHETVKAYRQSLPSALAMPLDLYVREQVCCTTKYVLMHFATCWCTCCANANMNRFNAAEQHRFKSCPDLSERIITSGITQELAHQMSRQVNELKVVQSEVLC